MCPLSQMYGLRAGLRWSTWPCCPVTWVWAGLCFFVAANAPAAVARTIVSASAVLVNMIVLLSVVFTPSRCLVANIAAALSPVCGGVHTLGDIFLAPGCRRGQNGGRRGAVAVVLCPKRIGIR